MSFNIGRLEKSSPHLMADLVELITTLQIDGRAEYRPDDIASIATGAPGMDDGAETLRDSLDQAWLHLAYRAQRFGEMYPFKIVRSALREKANLTAGARIYRLMLATSRLRSFERVHRSAWAGVFTALAREALTQLMPVGAMVKVFDANSSDRRAYYGTDLRRALKVLGKDLAASIVNDAECDLQSTAGDAGIDLVAIATWDDSATGIHAILGQCAARETDWPEKRLEAHALAIRGFFNLLADPVNAVFIPVLYRETNGVWISQAQAGGCLLVDRLRMLLLLRQRQHRTAIVSKHWFVGFENQFAAVKNSLVAQTA